MQSDGSLTPEWVEIGGMALPPFIVESLEERLVRSKCLPDNKIWGRAPRAKVRCTPLQGDQTGCSTGNGEKLRSSQAETGQAISSAVA